MPFGGALKLAIRYLSIFLFCLSCASHDANRKLASSDNQIIYRNCALAAANLKNMYDGVLYKPVDRFTLEYHEESELLKYADLFDEQKIDYRILRVEFPKSDAYTIEILPKGNSPLAKFLRRTKTKEKGIKILASDFSGESETLASFNRAYNWIILEKEFFEFLKQGDQDNWVPFLSHELRHAFFEQRRQRDGFLGYGSEIVNDGKVSNKMYDVYLSAEESYNYVKQFQSHYARYLKAKRKKDFTVAINMMDSMESAAEFGRENIQRFIDIYERALKAAPKLRMVKNKRVNFIIAEFEIDGEVLNVPIRGVNSNFNESNLKLEQWREQVHDALQENLEVFRGDLSRLNQMAQDSALGI